MTGEEPGCAVDGGVGRVAIHRAAHAAFNRRELNEAVRHVRVDAEFTDHAQGRTVTGPGQLAALLRTWIEAFPDAVIDARGYIDGGDCTVARFHGRGANDGPLGSVPASGRRVEAAFCEVLRYDRDGWIVSGDLYYDTLGAMIRLGLLHLPLSG